MSVTQNLSVQVTDVNEVPLITSTMVSVAENISAVTTLDASDPEMDDLTFSIIGGADAASFSLSDNGGLAFVSVPDFENPGDASQQNEYQLTVQVTDSGGLSTSSNLMVEVIDVNEAPVMGSGAS